MNNIDNVSLEELQREFLQVQSEQPSSLFRLSELNMIELVNYLMSTRHLSQSVTFTLDGQEYVTQKQMQIEILEHLHRCGGRIHTTVLPELLNIDFCHIEQSIKHLLALSASQEEKSGEIFGGVSEKLFLVQGELLTEGYIRSVCEEVQETLQESGVLHVGELAKIWNLPSEFLVSHMKEYWSSPTTTTITTSARQGKWSGELLYTQNYIRRVRAKIRGALSALTRPTPLVQIVHEHGHGQDNAVGGGGGGGDDTLFDSVTRDIIKDRKMDLGTVHRGIFVPRVYEQAMERAVRSFYEQNGYISFQRIESMIYYKSGANATRNFVRERIPDAIFVHSGIVSPSLCETLNASMDETLTNNVPFDILTVLPAQLDREDVLVLLAHHCPSVEKHRLYNERKKESSQQQQQSSLSSSSSSPYVLLNDSYIVTTQNIDDIVASFAERAKDDVKIYMASLTKKLLTAKQDDEDEDDRHSSDDESSQSQKQHHYKKLQQQKKKGNSRRGGGGSGSNSGSGSAKSSKKGSSSSSSSHGRDHHEDDGGSKFTKAQDKALLALVPGKKDIIAHVQQVLKDDAPSQYDDNVDEIYHHLTRYITPLLQDMYMKCRDSAYMDANSNLRKQQEVFERRTQELYFEILLHFKAVNALVAEQSELYQVDEQSLKYQLERYLMGTKCLEFVFLLVEHQALNQQLNIDTTHINRIKSEQLSSSLSSSLIDSTGHATEQLAQEMNRFIQSTVQQFSEENQNIFNALYTSTQTSVDHFLSQLATTVEHFNIYLRKLDKKKEKEFLTGRRHEMKSMILPRLIGPGNQLHGICLYLFLLKSNLLIHAPARLVPQLATYLTRYTLVEDAELQTLVTTAQTLVAQYLEVKTVSSQALFPEQEELNRVMNQLMTRLDISQS